MSQQSQEEANRQFQNLLYSQSKRMKQTEKQAQQYIEELNKIRISEEQKQQSNLVGSLKNDQNSFDQQQLINYSFHRLTLQSQNTDHQQSQKNNENNQVAQSTNRHTINSSKKQEKDIQIQNEQINTKEKKNQKQKPKIKSQVFSRQKNRDSNKPDVTSKQIDQNKMSHSQSGRKLKIIQLLQKKLKSLNRQLIQSQLQYIVSLSKTEPELLKCVIFLRQKDILSKNNCEVLFSSASQILQSVSSQISKSSIQCQYHQSEIKNNWSSMQKLSKKMNQRLTLKLVDQQQKVLEQINELIEGLQIYQQQYLKINSVLQIIKFLENQAESLMLEVNSRNSYTEPKIEQRVIYQHRNSKNIILHSQILQQVQISTNLKQNQEICHPINYQKYTQLLQVIQKIRRYVFTPLIKLSQFITIITKYIFAFMQYYNHFREEQSKNSQIQLVQNASKKQQKKLAKELMSQAKQAVYKTSLVLNKIIQNQYQRMSQADSQTIKGLCYNFPYLFFQQQQVQEIIKKSKQSSVDLKQYCYNLNKPLVISFSLFQILYMGIPCQLYLVKNHIIIIKAQNQSGTATSSKVKLKKTRQILKLAVLQIDHTTKIQTVSQNKFSNQGHILYISGGLNSQGTYLQFKQKQISRQSIRNHIKQCEKFRHKNNFQFFECPICQSYTILQSQPNKDSQFLNRMYQNRVRSNIDIFKTIVNLTISYSTFIYYCSLAHLAVQPAFYIGHQKIMLKVGRNGERQSNILDQQFVTSFHYNKPQQLIPNYHLLRMKILSTQYRSIYKQKTYIQVKYYIVELSLFMYDKFFMDLLDLSSQESNCQQISCILSLRQGQINQIQEYIFKSYPKVSLNYVQQRYTEKQDHLNSIIQSPIIKHYKIITIQQSKQLYLSSTLNSQQLLGREIMIITEFFNCVFKTQQFRAKPQMVMMKLGVPQGFWKLCISQNKENNKAALPNKGYYHASKSLLQCSHYPHQTINNTIKQRPEKNYSLNNRKLTQFWYFNNNQLSFPYHQRQAQKLKDNKISNLNTDRKKSNQIKKYPIYYRQCCIYQAYWVQLKQIRQLFNLYSNKQQNQQSNELTSSKEISIQFEQVQKAMETCQKIFNYHNKIQFIKYLVFNYKQNLDYTKQKSQNLQNQNISLLNTIVETLRVRPLNVLLYCLPSLNDYYHNLFQQYKDQQEVNNDNIFKEIDEQYVQVSPSQPLNHGFCKKLITNIHKNTSCKHLKYIIGQMLQLSNQCIMHFMETFSLVVVKLQKYQKENPKKNSSRIFLSNLWSGKQYLTYYNIVQLYSLNDHQNVWQILDSFHSAQEPSYHILIKKNIKIRLSTLPSKVKAQSSQGSFKIVEKENQQMIESYYKILQLQIAEIVYKLNHGLILIDQPEIFYFKYISLIFGLLDRKYKSKYLSFYNKSIENKNIQKLRLNQKLLIKTGVLHQKIFKNYYQYETPTLDQRIKRRYNLRMIVDVQIQSSENELQILNKIITLIYDMTNWTLHIEPILYISRSVFSQDNTRNSIRFEINYKYNIFISSQGIMLAQKQSHGKRFSLSTDLNSKDRLSLRNQTINKQTFSHTNQQIQLNNFIEFNYEDIQLEIFGTIITIYSIKSQQKSFYRQSKRFSFFSNQPYNLYSLILFYKIYNKYSQITKIQTRQSKIKLKFKQQNIKQEKKIKRGSHIFQISRKYAKNDQRFITQKQIQDQNFNDNQKEYTNAFKQLEQKFLRGKSTQENNQKSK